MKSPMSAVEMFAAYIDGVEEQERRLFGSLPQGDIWTGRLARLFRFDPHRRLTPNLEVVAQYLKPQDVFLEVGGGAGRVGLPMALRCREVINVDRSPGMGAEFTASAAEAGIGNARLIQADWLDVRGVEGDVVFTADVTYFVRDIVRFVRKMEAAARRRVIITIWSVPPPHRDGRIFRLVYGEDQARVAGHADLLAALWEMSILPDVRVLSEPPWWETELPRTREAAVQMALQDWWLDPSDRLRAGGIIETCFDELFQPGPNGYLLLWREPMKELLITWETGAGLEPESKGRQADFRQN
jgi:hypothetical protein